MLRIITPKGVLREVSQIKPVCETRVQINRKTRRLVTVADDLYLSKPTGLALRFQLYPLTEDGCTKELFIGNLKPEQVADIQKAILTQGYFDFSALTYQDVEKLENTVFDQGSSLPYTSDRLTNFFNRFFLTPFIDGDIFSQMPCPNGSFSSENNMQDECVLGWGDDDDDSEA